MFGSLDSHINALEMYQSNMDELRAKIGNTALFSELEEMGVDSLDKILSINNMTDVQLQSYVDKYNKVADMSQSIAEKELSEETFTETQEAFKTYAATCSELGVQVSKDATSMQLGVTGAIAKINEAFENFSPTMKMPHFSISGQLDVQSGQVPTVSVEWYKKAMDNAMLLNKPTIFGYSSKSNSLLGAGEAGTEVVSGASTLMNMIQNAVSTQNSDLVYYLKKIVDILATFFPQQTEAFRNMKVCLDTGAIVGELVVPMDEALGVLSGRKERGR